MDKLVLYYFSGTGNTERIANVIEKTLKSLQVKVLIKKIPEGVQEIYDTETAVALAFPANSQSVSPFIWKFIKALPKVDNVPVYVIMTMNNSCGVPGPLKKLLISKGYIPKGLCEISMPNNMLQGAQDKECNSSRIHNGEKAAQQFAEEIAKGVTRWESTHKGSRFVSFLSRNTVLPWVSMRLMSRFEIDDTKCRRCGLCVEECPANNIAMKEKPVHLSKCGFCMRCAAFCPQNAISFKIGGKKVEVRTIDNLSTSGGDN